MSDPERVARLKDFLEERMQVEAGPRFMGIPERWFPQPLFRCENGHVSTAILKSEALWRDACLECWGQVGLTYPEDREDHCGHGRHSRRVQGRHGASDVRFGRLANRLQKEREAAP